MEDAKLIQENHPIAKSKAGMFILLILCLIKIALFVADWSGMFKQYQFAFLPIHYEMKLSCLRVFGSMFHVGNSFVNLSIHLVALDQVFRRFSAFRSILIYLIGWASLELMNYYFLLFTPYPSKYLTSYLAAMCICYMLPQKFVPKYICYLKALFKNNNVIKSFCLLFFYFFFISY